MKPLIDAIKSALAWFRSQKPGAATKAREAYQESKQSPHGDPKNVSD